MEYFWVVPELRVLRYVLALLYVWELFAEHGLDVYALEGCLRLKLRLLFVYILLGAFLTGTIFFLIIMRTGCIFIGIALA